MRSLFWANFAAEMTGTCPREECSGWRPSPRLPCACAKRFAVSARNGKRGATSCARRNALACPAGGSDISDRNLGTKNALAKCWRFGADRRRMRRVWDAPELLRPSRRTVDHLRMAAGKRVVVSVANQKQGKGSFRDGFFRGDFFGGKSGGFLAAIHKQPSAGSKQRLAQQRRFPQTCIVVSRL